MQCPYCAEEIKKEAITCRYCGQNLALEDNKLLREKISALEGQISEASRLVAKSRQSEEQHFTNGIIATEPKWGQISAAVLLPALIAAAINVIYTSVDAQLGVRVDPAADTVTMYHLSSPLSLIGVSLITTGLVISAFGFLSLPFGLWAGLVWPGRHGKGYVLLGLVAGVLTLMGISGANLLIVGAPFYLTGSGAFWYPNGLLGWELIGIIIVGSTLLFLSGGLFADLIKGRHSPHIAREGGFLGKAVANLSGSEKEPSNKTILAIEIVKALGPAILPIITLISTIVVALSS